MRFFNRRVWGAGALPQVPSERSIDKDEDECEISSEDIFSETIRHPKNNKSGAEILTEYKIKNQSIMSDITDSSYTGEKSENKSGMTPNSSARGMFGKGENNNNKSGSANNNNNNSRSSINIENKDKDVVKEAEEKESEAKRKKILIVELQKLRQEAEYWQKKNSSRKAKNLAIEEELKLETEKVEQLEREMAQIHDHTNQYVSKLETIKRQCEASSEASARMKRDVEIFMDKRNTILQNIEEAKREKARGYEEMARLLSVLDQEKRNVQDLTEKKDSLKQELEDLRKNNRVGVVKTSTQNVYGSERTLKSGNTGDRERKLIETKLKDLNRRNQPEGEIDTVVMDE